MNYAYVRVSTKEQSETRQIECLKKYGIDKWYSEKVSGATMDIGDWFSTSNNYLACYERFCRKCIDGSCTDRETYEK